MDIEDTNQLLTYLSSHHGVAREEVLQIDVLKGGVSNRTVMVRLTRGRGWVIKQALEKLRVPDDWFSDPLRIHREAEGMRILKHLLPKGAVVNLVFEDIENHVIAMDAVDDPFVNWKTELLAGVVNPAIVHQFGTCLASMHTGFRLDEYAEGGMLRDQHFFESLRLEPYYARTADALPGAEGFIATLIEKTRARTLALVHGDYSPKNILVKEGRLILLDHEVIHIGDPAFDVGFSMTHLLSKANHFLHEKESFIDAAEMYWRNYIDALGAVPWKDSLEPMVIAHTAGCMLARVAGRSQLEYLNPAAKKRQRTWGMDVISKLPPTVPEFIASFNQYLDTCQS